MLTQDLEPIAPEHQAVAEELQHLYARMIGGIGLQGDRLDIWQKMDEVWSQTSELELSQGGIKGTFDKGSVELYLGGLPGFSILVGLQTPDGERNLQLSLHGEEPAFTIRPGVDQ